MTKKREPFIIALPDETLGEYIKRLNEAIAESLSRKAN